MSQTLDAVFEDGSFKPVDNGSLPFSEGQRVKLTYEGLSEEDIGEIERLALDRNGKIWCAIRLKKRLKISLSLA